MLSEIPWGFYFGKITTEVETEHYFMRATGIIVKVGCSGVVSVADPQLRDYLVFQNGDHGITSSIRDAQPDRIPE